MTRPFSVRQPCDRTSAGVLSPRKIRLAVLLAKRAIGSTRFDTCLREAFASMGRHSALFGDAPEPT